MSEQDGLPPLGYVPAPLEHHTVTIAFDALARSSAEAAFIVRETLIEDLAAPGDAVVIDGDRVFGEDHGEDVPSIRSWIPAPAAPVAGPAVPPPADLLAWRVLRALTDAAPDARFALSTDERRHVGELLEAADRDVIVPDPDDPTAPPAYEGPASEAHRWLPAGTYPATGADGGGPLRLVVNEPRAGSASGDAVAFTAAAHDAAALDRIFYVLEGIDPQAATGTLHAVNAILAFTGRPAADLDLLPKNDGKADRLLRGLLGHRGDALHPDEPLDGPAGGPCPGLSR